LGKGWGNANCLKSKAKLPLMVAWLFYLGKAVYIMKKRTFAFLIILIALLLPFTYGGCGGGGGGDNDDDHGTAPTISSVKFAKIVDDVPIETGSFDTDDVLNIFIKATDPDLDMNTLYISAFLSPNFDTPYDVIDRILPSQDEPTSLFWTSVPLSDTETGIWRFCLWIVDSAGNESNEFCEHIIVNKASG